jgi:hypothetical protein
VTVIGALSGYSSNTMSPDVVEILTSGLFDAISSAWAL